MKPDLLSAAWTFFSRPNFFLSLGGKVLVFIYVCELKKLWRAKDTAMALPMSPWDEKL